MGLEETMEDSQHKEEDSNGKKDWSQDLAALRFVDLLTELGAEKLFKRYHLSLTFLIMPENGICKWH